MSNPDNPVVVITGAASGIGLALAKLCTSRKMNVVMADNAVTTLCDKVEQISTNTQMEVMGVVCDVSKYEQVKQLAKQTYERFSHVDLLINNAGISGHLAPLWELTPEHVRKVLDVNLHGVIHGAQVFVPLMLKQSRRSHIVNMASVYALCSGSHVGAYSISKHGILALSESLYFDLRRLNKPIDVSVVCPSFVNTNLLSHSMPLTSSKLHDRMQGLVEYSLRPEELAEKIMLGVLQRQFYILPDEDVKHCAEERLRSIENQSMPSEKGVDGIIHGLAERAMAL